MTTTTQDQPVRTIPLPIAPVNASPVPHLTSIHSVVERGPYGCSRYRGNCGGYLIRDLLGYFRPERVLDPMTGSGTCRDVCRELEIECTSFDLKQGQGAGDPASYAGAGRFDFVWLHPPYWRMIRYNDDPRCLSAAPTLVDFLKQLRDVLRCSRGVLAPGGVIAVLIGGFSDYDGRRRRYIPLRPDEPGRGRTRSLAGLHRDHPPAARQHLGPQDIAAASFRGCTMSAWSSVATRDRRPQGLRVSNDRFSAALPMLTRAVESASREGRSRAGRWSRVFAWRDRNPRPYFAYQIGSEGSLR